MEVTLLTEDTRVHYTGDGVTKEFSYSFNPIDLSYVKVYKNLQQITTPDVTVASGVVTFNVAPAEGDSVVIMREKPLTYDSGIASKGIISSDSLDNMAVDLLGQIQQVNEKLDRVPVYPIDTTMTGEEILNQFNQDVQTVKDSRVEVEGKAEEINNAVSSGLTEINNTTSESKSQITEEKNTSISEIQRVTEGLIDRAEVAADESESWANKAESFANQANLDSIRTNCITAIPQDIKLELNKGMLTLKAGSKVYYPNGVGVFSVLNIDSDIVLSPNFPNANNLALYLHVNTKTFCIRRVSDGSSGTSDPGTNSTYYYNTATNIITDHGSTGNASQVTFPIAIISSTSSSITSIDQVFNGFGFIGSTIFELPGVEGLIPNGRNTDGSLNNTKFKTTGVKTINVTNTNGGHPYIVVSSGGRLGISSTIESGNAYYDDKNNLFFANVQDTGGKFTPVLSYSTDSTGRITSFNPKTTFQATDYYDFKQLDDSTAKLGGNNVFTGTNTLNSVIPVLNGKNTSDLTNVNGIGLSLRGVDSAGNIWSYIDLYRRGESKASEAHMYVRNAGGKLGEIAIVINDDGTTATSAPTPVIGSNSQSIATTAWVRQVAALKTGNETINGVKTFTQPIIVDANPVNFVAQNSSLEAGVTPSSNLYCGYDFRGKNNTRLAYLRVSYTSTGSKQVQLQRIDSSIQAFNVQSYPVTYVNTPSISANGYEAATTQWVNSKFNLVYPVGSLYFSTASTCPLQSLGIGTWNKVGTSLTLSVNTSVPVKGNGITLGLTDGSANYGLANSDTLYNRFSPYANAYGTSIGNTDVGSHTYKKISFGITTDASKSGVVGTVTRTQITVNIFQRTA